MTRSTAYPLMLLFMASIIFACEPIQTQQLATLELESTSVSKVSDTPDVILTALPGMRWGKGSIQQVAWSPDSRNIAIAGSLGIFLYSADTIEMELFIETDSWVFCIAYSPNGDMLASAHMDGRVHLWDAASGELIRSFEGHSDWVISLAFSKDGDNIASGSWDDTVRVWSVSSGNLVHVLVGHLNDVSSVSFNLSGTTLASSGVDGTIHLWHVETGELYQTLIADSSQVNCVAFGSDDRTLASGSGDHEIRIWDTLSGEILQTLKGHSWEVISVAFSPDGQTLASSSYDQTIRIWDLETGESLKTLKGHRGDLRNVAYSPEGSLLASASWADVYVWEMPGGRRQETIVGHIERLYSLAFHPEGAIIASGAGDGNIYMWQVTTGDLVNTIEVTSKSVQSIGYFSDGQRLVSGDSEGAVRLWDVESGELLNTLEGHTNIVSSVAISPDDNILASGSYDGSVRLWKVDSGEQIRILEGHNYFVSHVAFSPDGQMIATAGWDRTIMIWDVSSGNLIHTLRGHLSPVASVAFSRDGLMLASGSWDNMIKLWDPITGLPIRTLEGHTDSVYDVAFSPDGLVIASASSDSTIILWEVETGEQLTTFEGHRGSVYDLTFNMEGRTLASGGVDGRVRLWDLDNYIQTIVMATQTVDESDPSSTLPPIQVIGVATPTPVLMPQELSTLGPWFLYTLKDGSGEKQLWAMNVDGTGTLLLDFGLLQRHVSHGVSNAGGEGHIAALVGEDLAMDTELVIYSLGSREIRKRIALYSSEFRRKIDEFDYDDEYQWMMDPVWAAWRSTGDFMWSPDGRYLAFTAVIDGPSGDVYVYDTQTTTVRRLTSGLNQASLIDWSPDSRWIVHAEWVNGKPSFDFPETKVQTVWVVAADGRELRRLYDLSWYATAEISLGWLSDEVFMVESKDSSALPLPHSHLRTVNLRTGEVVPIHEEVFEAAALDSETGVVFLAKTVANGGLEGFFLLERDSWELVELDDTSWYVDSITSGMVYAVPSPYAAEEGKPGFFVYDSNRREIVTFPDEDYTNDFVPSLGGTMLAFNGCTVSNKQCGIRIYERNGVLKKAISIARGVRYVRWDAEGSKIWFALPPLLYSYRFADDKITMLRNDLPDVRDFVLVER